MKQESQPSVVHGRQSGATLVIVEVVAPREVVLERMKRRELRENEVDRSETDWAVYLKMKETAEPIERVHFTVDTSQPLEPALVESMKAIRS